MSKREKYEDISSSSVPKDFKERGAFALEKIKIFFMRNRKRNLKALLSILLCVVLIAGALVGAYLRKMLSLIQHDSGVIGNPDITFTDEDYDENISFRTISDIGASSVKDFVKNWSTNGGEKLYSKYVINVLLIGEDVNDGSVRSDTIMIASVNTKTKKITLCSIMRDSYVYMNINGDDRYDKINAAYTWGGAAKLMEVISDNFKIRLDHYVSIDFSSFKKAIDQIGGVEVPVTEAEARFMNRTTKIGGFTAGDNVLLNGERALIYARIRKLDSDEERTRRQRNVIAAALKKVKASSLSDINSLIETFLPYITTNYSSREIVSLGTQALTDGWQSFDINGMVEPSEECRVPVNNFRTYSGSLSVWVVDYTLAAREVQLALYSNTNIEIGADHVSPVDMVNGTVPTTGSYYYSTTGYQYYGTTSSYYDDTASTNQSGFSWLPTLPSTEESTRFVDRWTKTTESSDIQDDSSVPPTESEPYQEEPVTEDTTGVTEVYSQQ